MEQPEAKILVIDDSRLERKMLNGFLAFLGYEVVEDDGRQDTIELVREIKPDLIILDLILGDKDGTEICYTLKADEETRLIPVVMITGYADKQARLRGIEAGAEDFLIKPIDRGELAARVRSLLRVKEYYEYAKKKEYYNALELQVKKQTRQLETALLELKENNISLTKAHLDTMYRLSVAAEYRDEDTAGHIRRISHYSSEIARQLGLPRQMVENIYHASPLHDVGKIGVPDYILLRPGELSSEEWQIMKSHTVIGARILEGSKSELMQMAEQIAISHHEKFDGSGYPYGLKGDKIPLAGRIVALADVFDALTSKRIYKPVYSNEYALDYIEKSAGKHFDPEIVDAFLRGQSDILVIQDQFKEELVEKVRMK